MNVHQETPTGQLERAPQADVSKWIVNAWSMVGVNVVAKSLIGKSSDLNAADDRFVWDNEQKPSQSCSYSHTATKCTSEVKSAWLNLRLLIH